jgi:PAS domain S-box-containing protein
MRHERLLVNGADGRLRAAPQAKRGSDAGFPIVGVGASAGGLAASIELSRHLGPLPGAGIVIFHHLEPTHESALVEILSRTTPLSVQSADDGSRVEPNRIYIVPPNARLSIEDGLLKLTPRPDGAGAALPIDAFFESLAEDCQHLAIGVILSGSGADGSAGVRAIKAAGGMTFAQDQSAEYRSMPESAVRTGCVDQTLSPRAIAEEIVRWCAEPAWGALPRTDGEFQRLLRLLQEASGIDFANYKPATIRRRALRRVFLHHMHGMGEYLELLERDPAEAAALCEEVLIHVTSFFRDPASFEALDRRVYPKLLEGRRRTVPLRIWVPGCSTGEEVYSLAIGLLEFLERAGIADLRIQLFGTDVSAPAIARARSARYAESIRSDVSPERLERFFVAVDHGYQVRRDVREVCVFARHDATRDPPFSEMDLISCRNLMIYLGPALQARTLSIFHYALKDLGFLLLGSSETIQASSGFVSLAGARNLYLRAPAGPARNFDFTSPERVDPPAILPSAFSNRAEPVEVHREADRMVLAKFAPPGVIVTEDLAIVQFRGKTGPYLTPAPGAPSFELMRMAREELRLALRQTIDLARSRNGVAIRRGLRVVGEESERIIDLEVMPMPASSAGQRFFLVLFRETKPVVEPEALEALLDAPADAPSLIDQMKQELSLTREYLEATIERLEATNRDLRAANEEVVSSNEELRSTNDELQAAKEEILANNQELHTLNEEMVVRNAETKRLNEDLSNVLSSVEIPIVLIGRDANVRRFAPAAGRVLGLTPEHIGGPMMAVHRRLASASAELAADVLAKLTPRQRTLQDEEGHWYQLTARPYLSGQNRIDGTVLVAFDIDAMQKATERLAEAQRERIEKARASGEREFRDLLATAAVGILMTDPMGRIVHVNPCAMQLFRYAEDELQGQSVNLLVPERLRQRHEQQRSEYQANPEARSMGREREVVGLRKDGTEVALQITLTPLNRESGLLVVCFVTDLSARRESERRIVDYQEKLRQMSFDAALSEERARRRIAADLHDRIGQSLALSQMKLASMPRASTDRTAVDEAIELLAQSSVDMRTLIFDLSPPILYELGLREALSWLAEDLGKRCGLEVEVDAEQMPKRLNDTSAALVFRAVRELLTNVVKHAHTSAAKVSMRCRGDAVEIDVEDRGVGFDSLKLQSDLGSAIGRFGLFSVREQMSRLGGTVEIMSGDGCGTRVSLSLPL